MMEKLEFTIELNPITKKNHQQIAKNKKTGAVFVVPSQEYKNYEYAAGFYLKGKGLNISEPVNVKAIYYMESRRRVDIANLHSCLHDILVKYEVLADDNAKIIVSTDESRVRYDRDHPRTEVVITPASEEDAAEAAKFGTKKSSTKKEGIK